MSRPHSEARPAVAVTVGPDKRRFLVIVFIVNLADNFLEYIFDREQSGDTAVFVDNDCHVVVAIAKFLEERVEAFGFGNHGNRS